MIKTQISLKDRTEKQGSKTKRGDKKKKSRLWWHIHQWVGLKVTILLSFILLTGTIAVFGEELDWIFQPEKRVESATVSGPVNWASAAVTVAEYFPDSKIRWMEAPLYRNFSLQVIIEDPKQHFSFVYIHPTTGAFLGTGPWGGIKRVFRDIHRSLMLPSSFGVPIVSVTSILLLILFGTSFLVYKKWWRGFFKPIRFKDRRTAWGDFHRLAGLWSLWFLLLIGVTGAWYLVETLGGDAPDFPVAQTKIYHEEALTTALSLRSSQNSARQANPDLIIKEVFFPEESDGYFIFQGDYRAILVRGRANTVWIDPRDASVGLKTDGRDLNIHQRISEMADLLHFGTFGGIWTKMIWVFFGILLTGLSVSGAAVYSLRLIKGDQKNKQERSEKRKTALSHIWRAGGGLQWPTLSLVLSSFILLIYHIGWEY